MRFVPRPVMVGFVDALAIIIFRSQLPHVRGGSWIVYAIVVAGIALIYLVPRVTRVVPAPLIAVVALTAAALVCHLDVPTVKDMGRLPSALPSVALPDVPFDVHTLAIVWPFSLSIAVVGLMESLMTATLIDDITDTRSNKDKECRGQGIANVAAALVGGLPGCAMIGQSMINVQAGGRTRLSTLASGVFLLALLVVFGGVVGRIPVAALVAVMVVVSVKTFDWSSIRLATLRRAPRSETIVLAATVAIVVATDNLAYGVGTACCSRPSASPVASLTSSRSIEASPPTGRRPTPSAASCSSPRRPRSRRRSTIASPAESCSTSPTPTSGTAPPSTPSTSRRPRCASAAPRSRSSG